MILVVFEVTIKEGCMDNYLTIAAKLKGYLSKAAGFIPWERFSSLTTEQKILCLSLWESKEAVSIVAQPVGASGRTERFI